MSPNLPFNQLSPAKQAEFRCAFLMPGEPNLLMGPGVPPPQAPLYQYVTPATSSRQEAPTTQAHTALPHPEQPVTYLNYSVPNNTGIVGGIVTHSTLCLPCDIAFVDFWDRVCAQMGLIPTEAELGYKYSTDHAREDPHTLGNAQYLATAIDLGQSLVHCSRTRKIGFTICLIVMLWL
ncbi:hypothetical protein BS17DRAFT_763555 [Gyrodon lividus]|nr:hypothetical protein BS17DRAFT_763555 [Gyrodon lividus]